MPSRAPLEHRLVTHAEMRRMPDSSIVYDQDGRAWWKSGPWWVPDDNSGRLLGTELKRLSDWLYVLEPFNPDRHIR